MRLISSDSRYAFLRAAKIAARLQDVGQVVEPDGDLGVLVAEELAVIFESLAIERLGFLEFTEPQVGPGEIADRLGEVRVQGPVQLALQVERLG